MAWSNYWIWLGDRGKPMVKMSLLLETVTGKPVEISFNRDLDWPEWYLLHKRLPANQSAAFSEGAIFRGIRLSNCRINKEQYIFLDNLSFYAENTMPVECKVQPRPGIDLAPGQDSGILPGRKSSLSLSGRKPCFRRTKQRFLKQNWFAMGRIPVPIYRR